VWGKARSDSHGTKANRELLGEGGKKLQGSGHSDSTVLQSRMAVAFLAIARSSPDDFPALLPLGYAG